MYTYNTQIKHSLRTSSEQSEWVKISLHQRYSNICYYVRTLRSLINGHTRLFLKKSILLANFHVKIENSSLPAVLAGREEFFNLSHENQWMEVFFPEKNTRLLETYEYYFQVIYQSHKTSGLDNKYMYIFSSVTVFLQNVSDFPALSNSRFKVL